jgi:hypothetical protein
MEKERDEENLLAQNRCLLFEAQRAESDVSRSICLNEAN